MPTTNSPFPVQRDERSSPLRPFALGIPTTIEVSYTYPANYGTKMNSAGWIGDRSFAGKTVRQYGTVLDSRQELYLLTDSDIETLLRWMPGGWRLPKLRGILLVDFHLRATHLLTLTWPDIIATLNTRKAEAQEPAVKPGKKSRSRRRTSSLRPLTDLQRQALELYGTHNGKIVAIAEAMGIGHSTVNQHLKAAWKKLPQVKPSKVKAAGRTQSIPTDRRGQSMI